LFDPVLLLRFGKAVGFRFWAGVLSPNRAHHSLGQPGFTVTA